MKKKTRTIATLILSLVMVSSLLACGSKDQASTKTYTDVYECSDNDIVVSNVDELEAALEEAEAGQKILLHAGTYAGHFDCCVSGTEGADIVIASYPGERATLTIPRGSDGAALCFEDCSHVIVRDLDFYDLQSDVVYGILINSGTSYVTIYNCEFSHIVTSAPGTLFDCDGESNAIILFGETEDPIHHITIDSNKVHDNVNGWSENISVAGNCEYIYVYNNEVYDCTNIGIDFYGNAEYCPVPELDQARHCECKGNKVHNCNSFYAENAGIYVDGSYDVIIENNETYDCYYGIEIGSEEWRDYYSDEKRVHGITVRNNYIHDNTDCGMRVGGWSNDEDTGIVYDCLIENNKFENNDSEIILAKCDKIVFSKNTFTDGVKTEDALVYDEEIDSYKITNITCID